MHQRACLSLAVLVASSILAGCGRPGDGGELSPAGDYRQRQLDRALAGVTVDDGGIVAEPAPPLADDEIAAIVAEVDVLLDRGLRPPAIALAVTAVRGAPASAAAHLALGRALLTTRRTQVALAAFTTAAVLDPDHAQARYLLGVALSRLDRAGEAVAAWRAAIAIDPGHGPAHARLAAASWLSGDVEGARRHLAAAEALGAPRPAQLPSLLATGGPLTATVVEGRPAGESAGGGGAPVVGVQVRLNPTIGSVRANETSAAAGAPGEVVAGWNDYSAGGEVRAGVAVSLDGASWADQVVRAPAAAQSGVEGDPMTAADPRTGTVWVGAISFADNGGVFVARKQAGSTLFEPSVLTLPSEFADKGWMAAGRRPGQPDTTRLYLAYNLGLQRSDDLGDSWSAPVSLGSGVGFLPRVGPDGTVFISYWDYGDRHLLRRSYDGGQTVSSAVRITTLLDVWGIQGSPQVPGDFRVPQLASLAVDPITGALFCVYFDTTEMVAGNADVDLYLTRSDDGGTTWTPPVVISTDPDPPGDQFFPWLEVGHDGRLHLLYLDSSRVVQDDTAASAWLDAAYAWSDDGGSTWTAHRLTGASFDTTLTDLGNGQFIGDYSGLAILGDRVWPVYLSTELGAPGIYSHEISFGAAIFGDGFEGGTTAAWTVVVP